MLAFPDSPDTDWSELSALLFALLGAFCGSDVTFELQSVSGGLLHFDFKHHLWSDKADAALSRQLTSMKVWLPSAKPDGVFMAAGISAPSAMCALLGLQRHMPHILQCKASQVSRRVAEDGCEMFCRLSAATSQCGRCKHSALCQHWRSWNFVGVGSPQPASVDGVRPTLGCAP